MLYKVVSHMLEQEAVVEARDSAQEKKKNRNYRNGE